MNETTRILQSHRSERSYKSDPIPDAILDDIIRCAQLAPTSINSQQISIVVVRDPERRKKIAELAGNQPYIAQAPVFLALVADLHKTRVGLQKVGVEQQTQKSVESIVSVSLDAGIALGTLIAAAHSHGLGIVPIGGVRRSPREMIELLGLPKESFCVNGLVLGYVDEPAIQKPRMSIESFRHEEQYDATRLRPAIDAYDQTLTEFWKATARPEGLPWSQNIAGAYSKVYYPSVKPVVAEQGFTCEE